MLIFLFSLVYADIGSDLKLASNTTLEKSLRKDAFQRLVRDGNADSDPLIAIATNTNAGVQERWISIRALGKIGGKKVVRELRVLLKDPKSDIRIAACSALGQTRLWSVADDVQALLEDGVLLVRVASAQSLGEIGNPSAIPALEKALRDQAHFHRGKSLWVRTHFVDALGKIRNKKAYSALLFAIDDQDGKVQKSAIQALEYISGISFSEGRKHEEERQAWKRWLSAKMTE